MNAGTFPTASMAGTSVTTSAATSNASAIALVTSFVPTGITLALTSGVNPTEFGRLLLLVLALGTVFLALSFLISILSRDPARGVASSVLVWVLAVFVFDLAIEIWDMTTLQKTKMLRISRDLELAPSRRGSRARAMKRSPIRYKWRHIEVGPGHESTPP